MSLPPRVVSILCLVQILFIGIGFMLTRGFIHFWVVTHSIYWDPFRALGLTGFIYSYGLWFFLIPMAWGLIAVSRARIGGMTSVALADFIAGILLTIGIGVLFVFSAGFAIAIAMSTGG